MPEIKNSKKEQDIIKSAVTAEETDSPPVQSKGTQGISSTSVQEYSEMEHSVMSPEYAPSPAQEQPVEQVQSAPEQEYQGYEQQPQQQEYGYQDQQYQSYQPISISPDTMNEVAEQVVAEKLGPMASAMEKLLDQKTTFEAQIQYLDDRLKRIEKIIDRLQLSILQKVGEYVTNVEDVKREMLETQKSFKALWDQKERPRK